MIDGEVSAIAAWRKYLNQTQAEMASRLGISQAAWPKLEGRKKFVKQPAKKCSRHLEYCMNSLIFDFCFYTAKTVWQEPPHACQTRTAPPSGKMMQKTPEKCIQSVFSDKN